MDVKEKTREMIELEQRMKAEHGAKIHIVDTDADGKERHLWLKEPHRIAVGVFIAKKNEDFVSACETLFNNSVIQAITTPEDVSYFSQNTSVFYGIMGDLVSLIPLKKSSLTSYL